MEEIDGDIKIGESTWFNSRWRPAMAWLYLVTCAFDFLAAPILLAWYMAITKSAYMPWDPLTLKGGGVYHIAFGAIIGVTSWSKGQEKVEILKTATRDAERRERVDGVRRPVLKSRHSDEPPAPRYGDE
jgi:hypothetical protein